MQRIAWIWALVFSFSLPEVGTIFRATRICFFRNVTKPTVIQFGLVWIFETCHVIGLGLFAFLILPDLDVVKGIMLTNCCCLIPALLSTLQHSSCYICTQVPTVKYDMFKGLL